MPLTRRQIYRRRRIAVFGSLAVLVSGLAYLPLTLFAPVSTVEAAITAPTIAAAEPAELSVPDAVASAIAAPGDGVLAQHGTTEPVPMASITKLVTALVVLDAHPIAAGETGPEVTMTPSDVSIYRTYDNLGASVAPVRAGEVYTQFELLQIMLIDSAGNYAVSLVNWAFGSEAAFVDAARTWLAEQGLASVVVTEPTGRDHGNVATASDLLRLGEIALADPSLAGIVATPLVTIDGVGEVENSNRLLGDRGVDGIKTGTLNSFGANLLFSADVAVGSQTVPVVGVVLGAGTHSALNASVRTLLDEVQAGYREVPLIAAGDVVGEYTTSWETRSQAVAADAASLLVWSDTPVTATVDLVGVQLADAGTRIGSVEFTAGARSTSVPVELAQDIGDPGPGWRLSHPEIIFGMG